MLVSQYLNKTCTIGVGMRYCILTVHTRGLKVNKFDRIFTYPPYSAEFRIRNFMSFLDILQDPSSAISDYKFPSFWVSLWKRFTLGDIEDNPEHHGIVEARPGVTQRGPTWSRTLSWSRWATQQSEAHSATFFFQYCWMFLRRLVITKEELFRIARAE
jgi:hypothetical protein